MSILGLSMHDNKRHIKSFAIRNSRITSSQKQVISDNLVKYGLPDNEQYDFQKIFANQNPVVLDIGFGNGYDLFMQADTNRQYNFLGVEVYLSGIGAILREVAKEDLTNVRIYHGDAVAMVNKNIVPSSIDRVQLFFPDPWPKKKHHKRRIVQDLFVNGLHRILKSEGVLHIATDSMDYANHIHKTVMQSNKFEVTTSFSGVGIHLQRNTTKFEKKGIQAGSLIWDLIYLKS